MRELFKKSISVLLVISIIGSCFVTAFATSSCGGSCEYYPSIIIPGLFQSETKIYDENGEVMKDSNGNDRVGPFFLDSNEIILDAVTKVIIPMAKTLVTQKDKEDEFANALADVLGKAIMERIKSDDEGNFIYDVRATQYETSVAELSEYDKQWIYDAVPLQNYAKSAGEDHLYFFSYCSMDNTERLAKQIYDLVQKVKAETGHDKVNIAPISQGGALFTAVMEYYPQIVDDINRIVYIVPAVDGSDLLGDIYAYGLNDSDDAIYDYMIPSLMNGQEWLGYLIDMLIRILPKDIFNNVLDTVIDKLISEYLVNATALWSLIPQDSYLIAREKYLLGEEHTYIRNQTDKFYQAQVNAKKNILSAREKGVSVFDLCGYNKTLYSIAKSWDKEQADGIIQLDSTSLGATSVKVNTCLPEGYIQQNTYVGVTCSDPNHNHIDSYNMVDASTGLLPDNTYYFYGHNHETSGSCDPMINLATELLTDETYENVYSHPERFAQFNNSVHSGKMKSLLYDANQIDKSLLSSATVKELNEAMTDAINALLMTNVDLEKYNNAYDRLENAIAKANSEVNPEKSQNEKKSSIFYSFLEMILKFFNKALRIFMGDKGFGD